MKNKSKKLVITFLLVFIAAVILVGMILLSKVKNGNEIAELLNSLVTVENQSMDLNLKLMIDEKETNMHTTVYVLTAEEEKYIVMDQNNHPIYIVDGVLYLENGHAFLIHDTVDKTNVNNMNVQMFATLAKLYEVLDFTTQKVGKVEQYSIEVTGENAKELLSYIVPENYKALYGIETLHIDLVSEEDDLTSVSFNGSAAVSGKDIVIEMKIENFRELEEGAYGIPQLIRDTVRNVDKEALFNLTDDLYRLFFAFIDLTSQETVAGRVELSVNSGIIKFQKSYELSELKGNMTDLEHAAEIEKLPEMIVFLCMEGDIDCTEKNDGYHYTLNLNKKSMETITGMVMPEVMDQLIKLSKGNVEIIINNGKIYSIDIGIAGTIQSLFSKVQSQVGIEFLFD